MIGIFDRANSSLRTLVLVCVGMLILIKLSEGDSDASAEAPDDERGFSIEEFDDIW